MLDDVKTALQFLTRLPIRAPAGTGMGGLADASWAFPIVGLVVGALGALAYLAALFLGLPALLAACIAIATTILTTGALHEDGLADLFDALGGHAGRERALEIMRDSRIGTYGTLALVIGSGLRIGSLASLATPGHVGIALIASACLSRALMALLMAIQYPARRDGLGAGVGRVSPFQSSVGCGLALLALIPIGSASGIVAALGVTTIVFLMTERWTRRRLGGFTGDTVGGTQQLCETACLTTLAAIWS